MRDVDGRSVLEGSDSRGDVAAFPTPTVALAELVKLRGQLTKSESKLRDEAFKKAERFIQKTLTTAPLLVSKTFQNSELIGERDKVLKTARVDIEIRKGIAFA